jgi:hypothetical protein
MKRVLAVAGGLVLVAFVAAGRPVPQSQDVVVSVRCPAGNNPASVNPETVHVAQGGSIDWRVTGPTASDSIRISLKNPGQGWPFAGGPPRGVSSARATGARNPGTYPYNIHLLCRVPGGDPEEVTIDPDIIVDE